MGRYIVAFGIVLVAVGLVMIIGEKAGIPLGRLPGDIRIESKRGGFYFPIITCLLISAILSLISWVLRSR